MTDKKKKHPAVDLNHFTPDSIMHMGLCTPAFKKFQKKYGKKGFPLATRKADVIELMDQGKGEWVITFCIELMEKKAQLNFINYVLDEIKRDFKGKTTQRISNLLCAHINGKGSHSQEIVNVRKILDEEIHNLTENDWATQSVRSLYKGLVNIIRACSEGENTKQRVTLATRHFVEAYALNKTAEDEFFPIDNYRVTKFKEFGLYAMKLTEVFPFE